MALALTTQTVHTDLRTKRLYLIATPSGNYVTGGDAVNLSAITSALGQANGTVGYPGNIKDFGVISAPAGYVANLIKGATLATWKLQVFQTTSTGTVAAPTITTLVNASVANPVAVTGGALTSTTGEVGVTGVQAPAFTGTAAGLSELPAAAYPAGVLAGTFIIMIEGPKLQM